MLNRAGVIWLIHRLSVTSPREFTYRVKSALRSVAESSLKRLTGRWPGLVLSPASKFDFMSCAREKLFALPIAIPDDAVDRLLHGNIPLFNQWVAWDHSAAFWHTDPLTGVQWPHGNKVSVNHRPGNPYGDVRTLWELNRLQHLVALGVIANAVPKEREAAVRLIQIHMRTWLQANPFLTGLNFRSAMEESLRVVAVLHAVDMTREWLSAQAREDATGMLLTHGWHIERHLSLYSSTGNHTIAEAVGLLYLGVLLPEHARADHWRQTARTILAREAEHQVRKDGGPLEQAYWYLLFVVDLLWLAQQLLIRTGEPRIDPIDSAIHRGRHFLEALADCPEDLPRIGDGDDGYAISRWLQAPRGDLAAPPRHSHFSETGITATSFTGHDQLLFLHKDSGMPPSYGHGHSDALSVVWRWMDQDVLIDSGTHLYGGPAKWRTYFRSATSHNTVTVNGKDSVDQTGPFLWKNAYRSKVGLCVLEDSLMAVLAHSNGYKRSGFTHWRGILYGKDQFLVVWDALQVASPGPDNPSMTVHWHFAGRLEEASRCEYHLTLPRGDLIHLTIPPGTAKTYQASLIPLRGWQAPTYTSLAPCTDLDVSLPRMEQPEAITIFELTRNSAHSDVIHKWILRFREHLADCSGHNQ